MIRSRRRTRVAPAALLLAALVGVLLAAAAHAQPPSEPFAPAWGMLAGWNVFADKGCGACHSVRGVGGGGGGPDLGRIRTGTSFFEVGAAMWNHLPRMGERMRALRAERGRLTPLEASNLIAFLFTAQYLDDTGDAKRGEALFTAKSCAKCHQVGGHGGGLVGPRLDSLRRANSPVLAAAAMWNHAPQMEDAFKATQTPWPTFQGKELLDLIAFLVTSGTDTGPTAQVVPGTPDRGRAIFVERRCAACHAVGGKGPRIGPDLGRAGHHVSLTEFVARMWNHAPAMRARAREAKIERPELSGQDMADILAYLYTSRYFEPGSNVARGGQLLEERGCLGCHAVRGKGGSAAGDFARSGVVGSPSALIAAMWNHSRLMEGKVQARQVAWPELAGSELADISAYLASLSVSRPPAPSRAR